MFLKEKESGTLVKILDVESLFNPVENDITGKIQEGQSEQPEDTFEKRSLIFPSGEALPRCWTDADYRDNIPAQPQARS